MTPLRAASRSSGSVQKSPQPSRGHCQAAMCSSDAGDQAPGPDGGLDPPDPQRAREAAAIRIGLIDRGVLGEDT